MNILGLIVEYNPFHNGHLYHIEAAKKLTGADKCIAVMSGNYVQRGMPAFCDKYIRTEMALKNGVDLVIELPVYYATSGAEYFARGSINILNATGIVNSICFGTEEGDLKKLYKYANILIHEPHTFKTTLKKLLATGVSYPKARQEALSAVTNEDSSFLNNPNNILGLEYIRSLVKTSSNIKPYTVKRHVAGYHSTSITNSIASATAIRKALHEKSYGDVMHSVPSTTYDLLTNLIAEKKAPIDIDAFSHILHYIIKSLNPETLKGILDIDEGLENRIILKSAENFKISKLLASLKSKRYTLTKLQRGILHIILNITKEEMLKFDYHGGPQYIRVLGFKKESAFLLKEIENNGTLPIITNIKSAHKNLTPLGLSMLNKEIYSTDIYYIGQKNYIEEPLRKNIEYKKPLVII